MEKKELSVGDIVQFCPEHTFAGDLLVVTEPKEFGCMGYLLSRYARDDLCRFEGIAYLRPEFKDFELVGRVEWEWRTKE